jgi:16S rRNA (cytosine967-C5)-methyltransferase
VRAVLRLGLFEVMHLDRPPALATDTAVRLVKRLGRSSAGGMVNAVLRRATNGWCEALGESEIDVRFAHPSWLYQRWLRNFGAEAAEQSMAAAQEPATTWLWFLHEEVRASLVDQGLELTAHPWCPGAWAAPGDTSRMIQEVVKGTAYAQDPSSQLVAHVALAADRTADTLLDLCAAPGGKAALLLHHGHWNRAVAMDLRSNRARLMRSLLDGLGISALVVADAERPPFESGAWDLVMLDAPCTGTGTLRRHPELKWRLQPSAVAEMALKQGRLLAAGLELLSPSGTLFFTTCSVEPEENEGVVATAPDDYECVGLEAALPGGVPFRTTPMNGIRILPRPDGDGFTMHAMRRRGA